MKKYNITYISSTDNDVCHVWTEARNREEAISYVKQEYWDVEEIVDCYATN